MDRASSPLPSSVIEGVLEVTTVYVITLETRYRSRPSTLCASCRTAAAQSQEAQQTKSRPVATIRPLPATKEAESDQEDEDFPETFGKEADFSDTSGKEEPGFTQQCDENEEVCCENTYEKNYETPVSEEIEDKQETYNENTGDNDSSCLLIGQRDSCSASGTFEHSQEPGKDLIVTQLPSPEQYLKEPTSLPPKTSPELPSTQPPQPSTEAAPTGEAKSPRQETPKEPTSLPLQTSPELSLTQQPHPSTEAKPTEETKSPRQEFEDPCGCHRDRIRAVFGKRNAAPRRMEGCQNGNCHEGEGCAQDFGGDLKGDQYKETSITECLDEFLEELQLTHLGNYLRVLGCTCVRDLRLLEEPELNAIQLISRRRLLKRLETLSLHHEAPPADCSLEGWLTWYGLTHISGFLSAIGVHSVGDLSYLKEEDLELLKPVTRRRILSCYRK